MTRAVLQLGVSELLTAFEALDAVELAGESLRRAALRAQSPDAMRGSRFTADGPAASAEVMFHDERIGGLCSLPAAALVTLRAAGLTALAARELLVARVATAAVIGTGTAVAAQLTSLAHHLVNLSLVAVCPAPCGDPGWPTDRLAEHAADRGLTLSFTDDFERALLGADLVVLATGTAEAAYEQVETGLLAKGALLVNATGGALPERLVDSVDQIFVDQFADAPHCGGAVRHPYAQAGLGQVLLGEHPGRTSDEDTVLVELLGLPALDLTLASRLHEIALVRGLGTVLNTPPKAPHAGPVSEGTPACALVKQWPW